MKQISSATVSSTSQNYTHRIRTGGFDLVADEPISSGGQGAGPAPYDYYLAGLGACTAITLRMYAERKGWDLGAFRVELTLSKDREGNTSIERTLYSDSKLSPDQWDRLLEIAAKTPVTNTVRNGAKISTTHQ